MLYRVHQIAGYQVPLVRKISAVRSKGCNRPQWSRKVGYPRKRNRHNFRPAPIDHLTLLSNSDCNAGAIYPANPAPN